MQIYVTKPLDTTVILLLVFSVLAVLVKTLLRLDLK